MPCGSVASRRKALVAMLLGVFAAAPGDAQTLVGVTGDGDIGDPETLFAIDPGDASTAFLMSLGNGDDGETIGFHPDDGLLYHASGLVDPIWERIDVALPGVVATDAFTNDGTASENTAMVHDPATGRFLVVDRANQLVDTTLDGVGTVIGGVPENLKGLAFSGGVLYAASRIDADLFELDPADGSVLATTVMTVPGNTVAGSNGLTTHPDTGALWLAYRLEGSTDRHLGVVEPVTGAITPVGVLGAHFAGIAFLPEPAVAASLATGVAALLALAARKKRRDGSGRRARSWWS